MLDEDLNPLLIEINQGPTLSISTAVTKDLVEQMLEDICKIVIDRQGQRDGEAGNFVKIFRQPYVSIRTDYSARITCFNLKLLRLIVQNIKETRYQLKERDTKGLGRQ